ncbi:hypothetical protein BZL30_1227 [Mycobacterium kansasii]|uniref:Uncharacterized protein n=1 Tax=Mycobacterium kansasii TaxID=1768 RepID=A0A1V3XUN2_MYCKA|nr:hypothetical protein BZL30_1227 [Mycobacterium kansasii]
MGWRLVRMVVSMWPRRPRWSVMAIVELRRMRMAVSMW